MSRVCQQCGGEFRGRGRAQRCHDCYARQKHFATATCHRCTSEFQASSPAAKFCPDCRSLGMSAAMHKARPRLKYEWTEERDELLRRRYASGTKGRVAEISAELGFPAWCVKKRAAKLCLTRVHDRRDWTPEEERHLRRLVGKHTAQVIAKKLGRGMSSVILKLRRMGLKRRYSQGYTLRHVALGFGVDHKVVTEWIRSRRLRAVRRGTDRENDAWVFRRADLATFVMENPMAFDVRFVDHRFFMSLICEQLEERVYGQAS